MGQNLAAASTGECPVDLTLGVTLTQSFSLVVFFLSSGECQLYFGPAVFEVQSQGNEGEAFLLGLGCKAGDLVPVQQQLAGPLGFMVENVAILVLGNFQAVEPDFAILDAGKGLVELSMSLSQTFDFCSLKDQAALQAIENVKIMRGPTIAANDRDALFLRCVLFLFVGLRHGNCSLRDGETSLLTISACSLR
jgi:hypothetical protein